MSSVCLTGLLPEFGKLTLISAERWVAAALAQAAALRELDGWLFPSEPTRQGAAEHLHEAWRNWAQDAQAVLNEVDSLAIGGSAVPRLEELRDTLDRTRAMLRMSPTLILGRHAQVLRGETYPLEEVRREIRAEHCR